MSIYVWTCFRSGVRRLCWLHSAVAFNIRRWGWSAAPSCIAQLFQYMSVIQVDCSVDGGLMLIQKRMPYISLTRPFHERHTNNCCQILDRSQSTMDLVPRPHSDFPRYKILMQVWPRNNAARYQQASMYTQSMLLAYNYYIRGFSGRLYFQIMVDR